ncbi:hypothetical protein [Roseivivax sp. CAU 1761]
MAFKKKFENFATAFGVGDIIFTALGVATELGVGFSEGEIDSPKDFFRVLLGGDTDDIEGRLEGLQGSIDDLSSTMLTLGSDLQEQIDAQSDLLINADISSLVGRIDAIRAELSSYNPNAVPGEIGFVSHDYMEQYVRDLRFDSNVALNQITQIAKSVSTARDGYMPSFNTLAASAAAVEYAASIRLLLALNFDRNELPSRNLADGLDAAAEYLSVNCPPFRPDSLA